MIYELKYLDFVTQNAVYESRFVKHAFNPQSQTLFSYWTTETPQMSQLDFKVEMENWLNTSQKFKPLYLFDYCQDFVYPIVEEEQIWMAHLLNPGWIEIGLQKYAHIVPDEFISNLAVEQMFDEFFNMKLANQFEIRHFGVSEEETAADWLWGKKIML